MYTTARRRLESVYKKCSSRPLQGRMVGVEKECLRVAADGTLSVLDHPQALGSALTHSAITTDFSEALLEIVTQPFEDMAATLASLEETQKFVYSKLPPGECLWATSMPCGLKLDCDVPIGRYGTSNIGRMKNIYRRGLGLRYGRKMQAIAGVHYNYSYPDAFWQLMAEVQGESEANSEFVSEQYFALVRNILRFGWLIPYLFGASPAVCGSFFGGSTPPDRMLKLGRNTLYEPYATSLRMGDIGYQNNREESESITADYNSLEAYVDFLQKAVSTNSERYEKLGLLDADSEYQQLNTSLLQIENEYYSSIRPKQIAEPMEMPSLALARRGVRYVELRSLDVNAYDPLGINDEQLRFVESFMLFCMLCDSPPVTPQEQKEINANLLAVAHRGRDPDLLLARGGEQISLRKWGSEILDVVGEMCDLLDETGKPKLYCNSLSKQLAKLYDPVNTPSGRMLKELQDNDEDFFTFAMRKSRQHRDSVADNPLSPQVREKLEQDALQSLQKQKQIEQSDIENFDTFLQNYFSQSNSQVS
ncbi:glutamate--cysteine ligase [Chromatiales bacterium (ex Bugula neritina AB1)]|nr:glutamate--cysteine ligase [Chromatiales bacterium (ex Bugula neritina AB1)]